MASVFVQVNGSFSLILSLSYFFIIFFKLYFNSNKRPVLNRVSATCFAHSPQSIVCKHESGADTAFLIRGGPNSEIFHEGLRKLFKRSKFFVVPKNFVIFRVLQK